MSGRLPFPGRHSSVDRYVLVLAYEHSYGILPRWIGEGAEKEATSVPAEKLHLLVAREILNKL